MNFLQFLLVELIITEVDTGLLWCSVIISRRPRVFCVFSTAQTLKVSLQQVPSRTSMLIVLFVYYLVQSAYIDASPVPSTDNRLLVGNRCTDLTHCRTIWSIVWSCLVTIFSCTWVAVHPNIPCPKKREANTHLEIITLAYATMNFVIYIFWWNKPLNVNRPARVFRKSKPRETQTQARKLILEAWKLTWEATVNGLRTILCFIVGKQDEDVNLSHKDRVPMFWANSAGEQEIADVIVLGVGVCFGAIHWIA